jgi:hypothetical protein
VRSWARMAASSGLLWLAAVVDGGDEGVVVDDEK